MTQSEPPSGEERLADMIEALGAEIRAAWSEGCHWCVVSEACRGDRYFCAMLEHELAALPREL